MTACHAALTSMYLTPTGDVQACCMNTWHRLGNVTEAGLLDIWRGERAEALRDALARDDLSHGCDLCAAAPPGAEYARVYDRLAPGGAWPRQLELALTNACNLMCTMCNGDLSSAIRVRREGRPALPRVYDDAFFDELRSFLPHLDHVTFLGGEPFLGAESLRVLDLLVAGGHQPTCHVTTNGTQWNDRIASYLRALPVHVAISVDAATAPTYEAIRVGGDHTTLWANVERFHAATGVSLTFCLMRQNWHELGAVLRRADAMDVDVFVNQVDYPTTHGLEALDGAELAEIDRGWDAEERALGPLGRNAGVWERERARHRARRDRAAPVLVRRRPPAGPRVTVVADAGQVVTSVTVDGEHTDGRLPGALRDCAGRSLGDLMGVLGDAFGDHGRSDLVRHADGTEERRLEFTRDGATVTVVGLHPPPTGGEQQWWFTLAS